jgi:hypothetical protein
VTFPASLAEGVFFLGDKLVLIDNDYAVPSYKADQPKKEGRTFSYT